MMQGAMASTAAPCPSKKRQANARLNPARNTGIVLPVFVVPLPRRNLCLICAGLWRIGVEHILVEDGFLRADLSGLLEGVVYSRPFGRVALRDERPARGFAGESERTFWWVECGHFWPGPKRLHHPLLRLYWTLRWYWWLLSEFIRR